MITNYDIKKIIQDCGEAGFEVKVRDVAFIILSEYFEDSTVAAKAVYGEDATKDNEAIPFLKTYMEKKYLGAKKGNSAIGNPAADDLSFEQNKAAMVKLIDSTEKAMLDGEIEKKDGLKIIADLRVKLNDKFKVVDESKDSLVVVESKYNDVCEYCGHEIAVPTKEQLMKKYNLTEKK